MNCINCNKLFKNSITLRYHNINPPKSCIKIRTTLPNYCASCMQVSPNLDIHRLSCVPYMSEKCQNEIKSKSELELVHIENQKLTTIIVEQATEIRVLSESLTRECERYEKLALACSTKPTYTTTHNTVNQYLSTVGTLDLSHDALRPIFDNYTKENFLDGSIGLAQFTINNVLKDGNGNKNYIVSDQARMLFKYKTNNGIVIDKKGFTILNAVVPLAQERMPYFFDVANDFDPGNDTRRQNESGTQYYARLRNARAYESIHNVRQRPQCFCNIMANNLALPASVHEMDLTFN